MATRHSTKNEHMRGTPVHEPSLAMLDHANHKGMQESAQRAVDAYRQIRFQAEKLCEEMDDVTPAHGIVTTNLSEEDSVVTSVASVIASANHKR